MNAEPSQLIVVADDDDAQREELAEFLRYRGYRVMTADDGVKALDAILTHRPRIALVDVNMPGWDGIRVAEVTASMGRNLALILMFGDTEAIVRANQAHVSPYAVVEKPLPLQHIARYVDAILGEVAHAAG